MKPLASLTSGLLARKGQAKPAMRPQGYGTFASGPDDLGWNDMGPSAPNAPEVVRQQEALAERLTRGPQPRPEAASGKAAFTLRLDPERHLRLRIASAVSHLSSQQLVTRALDQFLETLPELDDLAARAKADPRSSFRA